MSITSAALPADSTGTVGGVIVSSIAYFTYNSTSMLLHFVGTTATLSVTTAARVTPLLAAINAGIAAAGGFVNIPPDSSGAVAILNMSAVTFFTYTPTFSAMTLNFAQAASLSIGTAARVGPMVAALTGGGFGNSGFGDIGFGD